MTVHTCFSVGYSGLTVPEVAGFLDATGALLIDVRLAPFSRVPGWSRPDLQRALDVRYRWVRQFGNTAWKTGGATVLADPEAGLKIVVPLLHQRPVILMCVESMPMHCPDPAALCHRVEVAELLRKATGCEVKHLRPFEVRNAGQLDPLIPNHRVTS